MLYVDEDNEAGKGLYKTLGFNWVLGKLHHLLLIVRLKSLNRIYVD
jgi:ribosomal protein S18 acetylase RimI-like enzyme